MPSSRNRIACLAIVLLPMACTAQSLQQAVLAALSHYPSIASARFKSQAALADISRAQGAHWPQLSWSGTYSDYTRSALPDRWIQTPVLSLNLWSGGRITSDVERSQALRKAALMQENLTRDDVALLSSEAYLQWAHHSRMVTLARDNLGAHEKILKDFQTISQIDPGRRIDLSQAQVRYDNAQMALLRSETDMRTASQRLERMLMAPAPGRPEGLERTPAIAHASLTQAQARLDDAHPAIARLLAQLEAAQAGVRYARSQRAPNINLTHSRSTAPGLAQGEFVTQLQVNLPLIDGGTATGAEAVAQANLQSLEADLAETRLLLQEQLASAWTGWQLSRQRADVGETQILTAQTLVQGYEQQFRAGRRSLLDLLNVQSDLFTYKSNTAMALHEARLSQVRILASLGQLAQAYADMPEADSPANTSTSTRTSASLSRTE